MNRVIVYILECGIFPRTLIQPTVMSRKASSIRFHSGCLHAPTQRQQQRASEPATRTKWHRLSAQQLGGTTCGVAVRNTPQRKPPYPICRFDLCTHSNIAHRTTRAQKPSSIGSVLHQAGRQHRSLQDPSIVSEREQQRASNLGDESKPEKKEKSSSCICLESPYSRVNPFPWKSPIKIHFHCLRLWKAPLRKLVWKA